MAKSNPRDEAGERSLWLFRGLIMGGRADDALDAVCESGRMERWGHAANIPMWADEDEVILVIDGHVLADRAGSGQHARLGRGDAFGKTSYARSSSATAFGDDVLTTDRETTICAIPSKDLQDIWDILGSPRRVQAGRWPRKEEVEVPAGMLLGTLPTTRVARILIHLVENYGEIQGSQARLPVGILPKNIALLAGITRRRANQVWTLFEGTGLVQMEGRSLIFSDLKELRSYA